ncbi:chemotaxis protein CheW [Natrinema zhouii]|uniref:Chemotaxis protein CheW n=1 Tax=Natrinema zhouii TaxID=1710539 RepID=A0A7D6H592_9EURY|nr:chemotaxis protein CheW [Natrinema zhouii]QLK25468.1 chemotaxis protein CheW [Natrinema zhouii]
MAPDLSEKLLGIDIDDADRTRDSDGEDEEQEKFVQFVVVAVGEHRLALPVDAVSTITEPPAELTHVPRSPPAIEGLMDLKGDITAVIDPRVHFPVSEPRSSSEQLLVLDRSSDQQSAAISVDDVIGVETVPESNVIDADTVDASELSGDALEHPLVVALITQEREPETRLEAGGVTPDGPADDGVGTPETGSTTGIGSSAALSSAPGTSGGIGGSIGETFEFDSDEDAGGDVDERETDDSTREIIVEATALVDIDRLLLAAGKR